MSHDHDPEREQARLIRQIHALSGDSPRIRAAVDSLFRRRRGWVRIPLGILFILGGIFSILPLLGLWMLPIGLMLLAFDLPALRAVVVSLVIRGRRWVQKLRHRWRR
ncbi:tryptophan synthase subunit beta [Oceanicola granulosus HTCC2516]|uniref:Tryptophan synthase subunit beta n=1 Tax=Oceanicola granulosus (strain ATCC BAA-861 / DSM 15982 / KCTC 12143 / HTCC2516) TaxID=314256 RepID=Q2CFN9_OCEGH|nr:hypothetical protein [Oceanicola granulosus]EAR51443.1 tryptophan synthase subunit beta [Oceanicola granulosus HTCC2516]